MKQEFKNRVEAILESEELPLVITHKNCMDGTGSVLAIAEAFQCLPSDLEVKYCQYGEDFSEIIYTKHDRNIIISDFSFSKEELLMLDDNSNNLIVIDHHKTAEEILSGLDFTHFDMKESGATLTYKCLLPNNEVPELLQYIKDRDIWEWKLPYSKEVSAGLAVLDKKEIDELFEVYMNNTDALAQTGTIILSYQNQSIKKATAAYKKKDYARFVLYKGTPIPFINATTLLSEIGHELSKTYPFAIMYFFTYDSIVLSLRSDDETPGSEDVSLVAKLFGGGGHKNASGCSFKLSEHPEILEQLFIKKILK